MVDNEEDAQDFLDRLDLDLEDFEDIETMKAKVDEIFEGFYEVPATDKQINTLFEAGDLTKTKFPEVGIRKIQFQRLGKSVTRYAIPFQQGLFGFSRALDLYKNL